MPEPKQCFISYSHTDHRAFERLLVHVKAVTRPFGFGLWHDRGIKPGDYWSDRIKAEIEKSDLYVLLATNDFLASDYIHDHELPAMVARHKAGNALLIPVIYRECFWRSAFGNYIEVVPKKDSNRLVPVSEWRDKEQAFAVAGNAIAEAIQGWFGTEPTSPLSPTWGAAA